MKTRRSRVLLVFMSSAAALATGLSLGTEEESGGTRGDSFEVHTLAELGDRIGKCERMPSERHPGEGVPGDPGFTWNRCTHLVFFWSPSMPLSTLAIAEIQNASQSLGVSLIVAPESVLRGPGGGEGELNRVFPDDTVPLEKLRRLFVKGGATIHFPSMMIVRNGVPQGNAIVGHKPADGYEAVLGQRLMSSGARNGDSSTNFPDGLGIEPPAVTAGESMTMPREGGTRVLWTYQMVPAPGAFFRRVPGTAFVAFDQGGKVYLRNLTTDEQILGPGFVDFVPTPDGRLFVTPGWGYIDYPGLEFYVASEVFRLGREGATDELSPIFQDSEMTDQYPSIGILGRIWTE
jgi:hypothetical protein